MAKKKKKKTLFAVVGAAVVVALVVVLLVLFLITPNPTKLKKTYESKDYAATYVDQDTPLAGAGLEALDVEWTLTVVASAIITCYENVADAKDAVAEAKEAQSEDSETVIIRRGNAVFVGDKETAKVFRGQAG